MRRLRPEDLGDLLEQPLVAVLATHWASGEVLLSPVWHEWHQGGFWVSTSPDDVKVRHLRRDPRATIAVFESELPYRSIEVRGRARLQVDESRATSRRIAARYVGLKTGEAYADEGDTPMLIRLEPGAVRAWDFADEF